jgi:hypothetical protein
MKMTKLFPILLALSFNAFAGAGEGGGHPLESKVKDKLVSIMDDILVMSDSAKSKLKFDYQSLNTVVKLEVSTLCATNEQLPVLETNNKLAYVFKGNSRIIRLNCSSEQGIQDQWNKKLSSNDDVDFIFFIHEAIRAQNILDDDNYEFSSSYVEASRKNVVNQNEGLFKLMYTRNNDCSLSFSPLEKGSAINVVNLSVVGKTVNTYVIGENENAQLSKSKFLNASSGTASSARKQILFKAQENKCFN